MVTLSGLAVFHPVKGVETTASNRLAGMIKDEKLWVADKVLTRPAMTVGKWYQKWLQSQGKDLTPTQVRGLGVAEDAKMIFGVADFPNTGLEFGRSVEKFMEEPTAGNLYHVIVKGSAIGAPVNDLYDLCKKHIFTDIPGPITTLVKGVGPVGMMIGMGDFGKKSITDITQEAKVIMDTKLSKSKGKDREKKIETIRNAAIKIVKAVADLAFAVSYFVLAVLLFGMFWFSLAVPGWIPLALATSALIAQLVAKFWDKVLVQAIPPSHAKGKA